MVVFHEVKFLRLWSESVALVATSMNETIIIINNFLDFKVVWLIYVKKLKVPSIYTRMNFILKIQNLNTLCT